MQNTKKSIFDNLPENLDDRTKLFLESVIYISNTIEFAYENLKKLIENNELSKNELVMLYIWSLIDNFYRMYKIVNKMPGLKKKEIWFQQYTRECAKVEDIRHFHQHFDNDLESLLINNKPLLGHISWIKVIDEKKLIIMTFIPGNVKKTSLFVVNPLGKNIKDRIDLITYYIGDEEINISNLYYSTRDFMKYIDKTFSN